MVHVRFSVFLIAFTLACAKRPVGSPPLPCGKATSNARYSDVQDADVQKTEPTTARVCVSRLKMRALSAYVRRDVARHSARLETLTSPYRRLGKPEVASVSA